MASIELRRAMRVPALAHHELSVELQPLRELTRGLARMERSGALEERPLVVGKQPDMIMGPVGPYGRFLHCQTTMLHAECIVKWKGQA